MRWMAFLMGLGLVLGSAQGVAAEDRRETGDRMLGNVISGLLGEPASNPDAAYLAKERERLATMLQAGEYVTSRQGEPVDAVVLGIPLTKSSNVYVAKPIPPSR